MADVFPANQQGRVLGVLNFAYSLGRTFGPIVGGNMADGISLRSSLYLALGLSGIDFILTSLMDPEGACQHRQEKVAKKEVQSLSPLPVSTPPSSSIIQIIKVPSYLIVSAAYFLIFIAFLGFDSVYAIHLNTKFVMSPSKIGIITLAYTVSFTIFSLVAGYISDKIAKQHVVSTGLILQAVSAGLVFLAPSEVTVCVAMAAFGAAFSIATVPYYPLTVQIVTKAGLSNVLTKVSAMNGIISGLGQIAGPLFVGTVKNNELFFGIVGCLMLAYTPIVALHLWWFLRRGSSEGNMGIVAGVEKKEERDEPSPTSGSGEELGADLEANRRLSLETKTDLESRTTMVSSSKGEFSGGTSIGCQPPQTTDTALLLKAVHFAAIQHKDQRRKDEAQTPYINHPIDVAHILQFEGHVNDIEVLQAAVLHDTVEDTDTTFEELEVTFGPRVRKIVQQCTDDKSLAKEERKR
ncbi:Guanosine-3',5'-bis(diphosphate) 3'-pyrophosphohydrolase MESH1 [Quaeritorhiza haematococci]|nr:Guanosine-3',5'-bis(diphosphate) 3'-pyrophosphohydrolase MESH1 [Quaeritorhiza haematococci]